MFGGQRLSGVKLIVCVLLLFVCLLQVLLSQPQTAELLSFLTPAARPDVKGQATGFLLGLSGSRWAAGGAGEDDAVSA